MIDTRAAVASLSLQLWTSWEQPLHNRPVHSVCRIGTGAVLWPSVFSRILCSWARKLGKDMLSYVLGHIEIRSRGQGMLEYALIIALVAVVVIAALVLLGPQIANIFKNVNSAL